MACKRQGAIYLCNEADATFTHRPVRHRYQQ